MYKSFIKERITSIHYLLTGLLIVSAYLLGGCGLGGGNELEKVRIVPASNLNKSKAGVLLAAPCSQDSLRLIGTFTDGGEGEYTFEPDTDWSTSDPSVVQVGHGGSVPKGVITPRKAGTARISADFETFTGTVKVRVFQSDIKISPVLSRLAIDTGRQMYAEEILTDPKETASSHNRIRDITKAVIWNTQGPISVNRSGLVTAVPKNGVASGTATLTAAPKQCPGRKAKTRIRVTQARLTGLTLSSPNSSNGELTLPVGAAEAVSVKGEFSDGTTQDLTAQLANQAQTQIAGGNPQTVFTPSKASGNAAAFLPVNARSGLRNPRNALTGDATGSTRATATFDTANAPAIARQKGSQPKVEGHLQVKVETAQVQSLSLSPAQQTISVGSGQQYTASAKYGNRNVGRRKVTTDPLLFYSSGKQSLAQAQNGTTAPGLVVANANGNAGQVTIKSELFDASGPRAGSKSAILNVDATLPSNVEVSDPNGCATGLAAGQHCRLQATARINDRTEDVTRFAIWRSNNPGVAKLGEGVTYGGRVGAAGPGTAKITASFRGIESAPKRVSVE